MFRFLAKLNNWMLPNFAQQKLDLAKATKWQKALIAWKYYVTSRAINQ